MARVQAAAPLNIFAAARGDVPRFRACGLRAERAIGAGAQVDGRSRRARQTPRACEEGRAELLVVSVGMALSLPRADLPGVTGTVDGEAAECGSSLQCRAGFSPRGGATRARISQRRPGGTRGDPTEVMSDGQESTTTEV